MGWFDFLTAGGAAWHETLPFVFGFVVAVLDWLVGLAQHRHTLSRLQDFAYMFSEAFAICIAPIYAFNLVFNPRLAAVIADKNGKVIAFALFVAVATVCSHLYSRWFHNNH